MLVHLENASAPEENVKTKVIPTNDYYHRIVDAPDDARRKELFLELFVKPWQQMMDAAGATLAPDAGSDPLAGARAWTWLLPEDLHETPDALALLEEADAWTVASRALARAADRFSPYSDRLSIDNVEGWLMLADPRRADPIMGGYTGAVDWFQPRFVGQYDTPTGDNVRRLPGLVAHEMHHLLRLRLFPWDMANITVADYIIHEGLAESFAVSLFGEEVLGPYVTEFNDDEREKARRLIGEGLQRTGFNVIRAYIFGDYWAQKLGLPAVDVPTYGGYAIGYHVVQAFLQRTAASVEEATFIPAADVVKQSGYFGR